MGIDVYVPCPISTWLMMRVTRPSLPIRMKAFGAKSGGAPSWDAARARGSASRCHPSSNPPPAAAPADRSWRRDIWPMSALIPRGRRLLSCLLDRRTDAGIGAAAADVPRHGLVDIGVGGSRDLREQRGGGHDLAGLAVTALHDLQVEPGLLNPLADVGVADRFDGGDGVPHRRADRRHAGTTGDAVQVHRASAAERGAATELGPVHAEQIAQDPQEWHVRRRIDGVRLSVDVQRDHEHPPQLRSHMSSVWFGPSASGPTGTILRLQPPGRNDRYP